MWLTLAVVVASVLFLWWEGQAVRRGVRSQRQFVLRAVGCALLLVLALMLQFKEVVLPSARETSEGIRLLRLLQFSIGVFVLVIALVLVALLDARETLQRYMQERRRMIDSLVQTQPESSTSPSNGKHEKSSL
ncbi:MAG: hypothetical protein ACUVSV_01490 [Armatimonadota bacterium]